MQKTRRLLALLLAVATMLLLSAPALAMQRPASVVPTLAQAAPTYGMFAAELDVTSIYKQTKAAVSVLDAPEKGATELYKAPKCTVYNVLAEADGWAIVFDGVFLGCIPSSSLVALNEAASGVYLLRTTGNTNIYATSPSYTTPYVLGQVKGGTTLVALAYDDEAFVVLHGKKTGFVDMDDVDIIQSDMSVAGAVYSKPSSSLTLYAGPSDKSYVLGKLTYADGALPKLGDYGKWTVVDIDGLYLGFVKPQDAVVVDATTTITQFVLVTQKVNVCAGLDKSSPKLGSLASGALVPFIGSSSNAQLIQYNGGLGLIHTQSIEFFAVSSPAIDTVRATKATTLYAGTGTNFKKLGQLALGEQADKLGQVGSYVIVRYAKDQLGCVSAKDVQSTSAGTASDTYVETTVKGYAYAGPSAKNEKLGEIYDGSLYRLIGTKGDWVLINFHGVTGYVHKSNVRDSTFTMKDAVPLGKYDAAVSAFTKQVNAYRKEMGLAALKTDAALTKAAKIRVKEIVQYFDHVRPDGEAFYTVDERNVMGENIAKGASLPTPLSAAKGFMSSPGHKENIMGADYTKTGVACLRVDNVFYWVQLFG